MYANRLRKPIAFEAVELRSLVDLAFRHVLLRVECFFLTFSRSPIYHLIFHSRIIRGEFRLLFKLLCSNVEKSPIYDVSRVGLELDRQNIENAVSVNVRPGLQLVESLPDSHRSMSSEFIGRTPFGRVRAGLVARLLKLSS